MKIVRAITLFIALLMLTSCAGAKKAPKRPDTTQIRSICELATLECYYHNVAKSVKTAGSGFTDIGEKDRKFWIEYTGTAKIGIDMSKVCMKVEGTRVTVYLPNAELLSINIKEQDLNEDSYISSGDSWFNKNKITAEDQISAINNAQNEMKISVESNTALLLTAQSRAQDLIENYINLLGELSGISYEIQWIYDTVEE